MCFVIIIELRGSIGSVALCQITWQFLSLIFFSVSYATTCLIVAGPDLSGA